LPSPLRDSRCFAVAVLLLVLYQPLGTRPILKWLPVGFLMITVADSTAAEMFIEYGQRVHQGQVADPGPALAVIGTLIYSEANRFSRQDLRLHDFEKPTLRLDGGLGSKFNESGRPLRKS
jgi:hypothetical protein